MSGRETLEDIAVAKGVGYLELADANPDANPDHLEIGQVLNLPLRHLTPLIDGPGIVINLGDLRLHYTDTLGNTTSWPIGIGRQGRGTPLGSFVVTQKRVNPVWRPTPENRREQPSLPAEVPPGPKNPLGKYAIRIGSTDYEIHGTNRPTSVGRYVSRGCIRLYPADIEDLFKRVEIGTPIRIVDEPIKVNLVGKGLYIEVHRFRARDAASLDKRRSEAYRLVRRVAGDQSIRIDRATVDQAVDEQIGIPVAILH